MTQIIDYIQQFLPAIVLFGSVTIVEIAPIKLNPWSYLEKLIKKIVGTDCLDERFEHIDKKFEAVDNKLNAIDIKFNQKITSVKKESAETEVINIRTYLINLWCDIKFGALIEEDQAKDAYEKIARYEDLCTKYNIENSQCDDAIEGIRRYYTHPELYANRIIKKEELVNG